MKRFAREILYIERPQEVFLLRAGILMRLQKLMER